LSLWAVACGETVAPPPSCAPAGAGRTDCGSNRESCCTSGLVSGGTYFRTYDLGDDGGVVKTTPDGGPTGEANPATVSDFRLDKYLVTVGRFRQFVKAWKEGTGYTPPPGSGKHTYLNGGNGLANSGDPGTYETGWVASDNSNVEPTDMNLSCMSQNGIPWPPTMAQDNLPMTCVNWYEAYAFCIWDGGFLPSEAEWEYAAAGGAEQREYPWGSADPGVHNKYAIYGAYDEGPFPPVGAEPLGAGRWGQLDLAGYVFEWARDWWAPYIDPCQDCADVAVQVSTYRVTRGGDYSNPPWTLVPSYRLGDAPSARDVAIGFRCARAP
jgi:formylglycine-generating enzyme required for sulfatase activity